MTPGISDGADPIGKEAGHEEPAGSPPQAGAGSDQGSESEVALNRLLEDEPRSLLLNIRKADRRVRAGDDDLACYFYRRALAIAADGPLPEAEAAEVRRAELALGEAAGRAHSRRSARLIERGLPPQQWSPRLRASLALAASPRPYGTSGPDEANAQDPTHHFYPGLPRIPFHDPARFDWVPAVEAATAAIRDELSGLLSQGGAEPRPFAENDDGMPLGVSKALPDGRNWGVLALCEQGWVDPEHVRHCPRTWETLLGEAPVPRVPGWGPSVIFSLLKAGAHIGAHTGMYNSRLICHLPLIVPPGCRFRVGSEVREWEVGKLLIFDDSIEHEAWNDGPEDRVVLIFDIWRPELTEREKYELTLLFSD